MRRYAAPGLVILAALLLPGCSTHYSTLSYDEFQEDFDVRTGRIAADTLGTVKGSHGGPVWESCTYASRTAVWKMIHQAQDRGANAVGNIRWKQGSGPRPTCKKKWGWIVFFPAYFTSLFMSAGVEAEAYYVEEPLLSLYMLPESEDELVRLVERITAETLE